MKLSELKAGEKGVIIKVLGHGGFRRRIIEMGFIKGKTKWKWYSMHRSKTPSNTK